MTKDCKKAKLGASKKCSKVAPVVAVEVVNDQVGSKNEIVEEICKTRILEPQETRFPFSAELEEKIITQQLELRIINEDSTESCATKVLDEKHNLKEPFEPMSHSKTGLASICLN